MLACASTGLNKSQSRAFALHVPGSFLAWAQSWIWFFFFFFDFRFYGLSRLFHSFWAESMVRFNKNKRSRKKSHLTAGPTRSVGCAILLVFRKSRVRAPVRLQIIRRDSSWNNFYGHPLPTTGSSKTVVSFWKKYCLAAFRLCGSA